jgi:polyphosphate kinase
MYSHIGTGNYNEKTQYDDISYFTSRSKIGIELNKVFNMITGVSIPGELKEVRYSPAMRSCIIDDIRWVATHESEEQNPKRLICIKVNAISDREIVSEILRVADEHKNVMFHIICRGVCSLPARENVKIKSIVGRFLEHSRIYMFQVGKERKVYIASADLLTRNLDRRVELAVRVNDSSIKKVKRIFDKTWEDTANTYWLTERGEWIKDNTEIYKNSQDDFTMPDDVG